MRRIALFVCLLSAYSLGQGGAATGIPTITNTRGEPVPYATVAVCVGYPGAVPSTPCGTSTLATIATDLTITKSCTNNLTPPGPISGAGCSNPGKSDGLGNIVAFAVPGLYWCQYSGGSIIQPVVVPCFFANGTGGGIPFACAQAVTGSIVDMTSPTTSTCDPFGITDNFGHWIAQSFRAKGPFNGVVELSGGLADPTFTPDTNSFSWLAPLTVVSPFYMRPWNTPGTVGQIAVLGTQASGTNGTIDALDWLNSVITINSTSCPVGGSCSISAIGTTSITATSPIVATPSPITTTGVISCPTCATTGNAHGLSFTIYNSAGLASGSTTASTDYLTIPFGCTIGAYNLAVDTGTITVKFWKIASGTAIPTSSNSINTSGVGISSGTAIHSTTLSDFTTTTITANDIMAMNITAVSGATLVNGVLQCQ